MHVGPWYHPDSVLEETHRGSGGSLHTASGRSVRVIVAVIGVDGRVVRREATPGRKSTTRLYRARDGRYQISLHPVSLVRNAASSGTVVLTALCDEKELSIERW